MAHLITLATCNLNQWALDFEGNKNRIIQSIVEAKKRGAHFRTGPELEISGYGCLDHFLEGDTFKHSWEVMAEILADKELHDILIDVGMPIQHKNVRYNCRVIILNSQILLIRPKLFMADNGNYRETRYFTPWTRRKVTETHTLPISIRKLTGQRRVPIGDGKISIGETALGFETCEELFTALSPHIDMALDGVEIFANSSGSHHELRKLDRRIFLIESATKRCGGVYLYANQRGCDGDRLYYDGSAIIALNGDILAQGSQFSLKDVEVITATVNLDSVRSFRCAPSYGMQSDMADKYPKIECDLIENRLTGAYSENRFKLVATPPRKAEIFPPEEEIALGPACWLWDYLRRSGQSGFFLCLSGGIDSCSTAVIVYSMCRLVVKEAAEGNEQVIKDVRRITGKKSPWIPKDPKELCNMVMHTCYMSTRNSSDETRGRAKKLAEAIGTYHLDVDIQSAVDAVMQIFTAFTGKTPKFALEGGTNVENIALQNVQARLRMVVAYLMALLLPWVRGKGGGLLVLGSANVDEALRGYFTKYDCSSADINPIGSISKVDLKKFISWAHKAFSIEILQEFIDATPTAELEPSNEEYTQNDERDMGFTYEELSTLGYLRKVNKFGPYSMFMYLSHEWTPKISIDEIADKVKKFFYYYAINRHKMTTLTPSYHAEQYSPDDNRFDLRPFLIQSYPYACKRIDAVKEVFKATETDSSATTPTTEPTTPSEL